MACKMPIYSYTHNIACHMTQVGRFSWRHVGLGDHMTPKFGAMHVYKSSEKNWKHEGN